MLLNTLVRFANAEGGKLVIGIEDNGEMGFNHSKAKKEVYIEAPFEHLQNT